MSYFSRLMKQSQLHVRNSVGGSAPSAGDERGLAPATPPGVLEIDVVREAAPDIAAAPSSDVGATPPAAINSASFAMSPPPVLDRTQPPAPADSSARSRPPDAASATPLKGVPGAAAGAPPMRVLQEVVEWIAAGSETLPMPGSKNAGSSEATTEIPIPTPTVTSGPKAGRSSPALPASGPARETAVARAAQAVADGFSTPTAERVVTDKVGWDTQMPSEIETRDVPVASARPSRIGHAADFDSPSTMLPAEPVDTRRKLAGRAPLDRDLTGEDMPRIDETFEVSIGAISVHVEAPARATPIGPAPLAPAAASQSTAARTSGRLQRHYLR